MFITVLFTIAKLWKQPKCPTTDEWIKKISVILAAREAEIRRIRFQSQLRREKK
jgi:hypothetical protein